ncbi:MAG TPA: tetratricopeptide repeat protein [Verrucomicrobiae bacterium]|nr:tetratricopeptide repeat protein [Verrucomicrobiae bacterium]
MAVEGTEQRKLAAIMFTDMVGYSALVQQSEALALELLEEHRRLLRSLFPRFNGTEVKTIGDAFLVEFGSALEAAQCAIEIQRTLAKRNADVSAASRIQVRIGIHIGDVIHRESDVLGDGVNIASRIQQVAEPDGICVSMDVERQIRHALAASLIKLPPAALKNIRVPMDLFRIVLPWEHQESSSAGRRTLGPGKPHGPVVGLAVAVVIAILIGVGLWLYHSSGRPAKVTAAPPTNAPIPIARAAESRSVAVLPFANMSADRSDEYLGDGISEEIITALSKVKGLRVPARTSCFAFKGKNEDIRHIGEQLGVGTVLEGSITKSGSKLRVTAQLINVTDGFHLWSETYDRGLDDLLAIRADVAERVAEALKGQLLSEDSQHLTKPITANAEAYRLYVQGRYLWNQRTSDSLKKAADYLEQAVGKDPNFALAYAALADCYLVLPGYTGTPAKQSMPKARAAALRALELDNTLGEAHAALGSIKQSWDWDWPGAEAEFKRAIELNPNYATAHLWYSILLRCLGRFDEAIREIRRAQDLDPVSPVIGMNVGGVLVYDRRPQEAITEFRKVVELSPDFPSVHETLGDAYIMAGMFTEAIAELQTMRRLTGSSPDGLGDLGYAYAVSGRTNEAHEVLHDLMGFLQRGYDVRYLVAWVHNGLGDRDEALAWLEQAIEAREDVSDLKIIPFLDNLRSDPTFIALLKKVGLEK